MKNIFAVVIFVASLLLFSDFPAGAQDEEKRDDMDVLGKLFIRCRQDSFQKHVFHIRYSCR